MNTQNTEFFTQIFAGQTFDLSQDFGLIRATGADARNFLHGQLTQDILNLGENDVRLAGYCSAKGRMYAMFYVWADGETVYLLTHASVIDTVLKRLKMFVLRAKVVLEHVSNEFAIHAYAGADALAAQIKVVNDAGTRLGLMPADLSEWAQPDLPRELRISNLTSTASTETTNIAANQLWQWLEIMAGVAHVRADISEAFVPQMMNLDRIGGVNFKKGCYPGQEIVARSHYLGKLKRRMQSAYFMRTNDIALHVGMDVYSTLDESQAAGQLLAFAAHPFVAQRCDVLYEVSLPLLENGAQIHLKDDATQWRARPLPYTLSDA